MTRGGQVKLIILTLLVTIFVFISCGSEDNYGFKDQVATGEVREKSITFKSGAIDSGEDMMVALYNRVINNCSLNDILDPNIEFVKFYVPRKVGVYKDISINLTSYFPEEQYEYQGISGEGVVEITKFNDETKEIEGRINVEITEGNYFNGNFSFTGCK
jgi:hypothetical protein